MAVEGLVNVPISHKVLHSFATIYLKAENMLCKGNVKISNKIRPALGKSNSGLKLLHAAS